MTVLDSTIPELDDSISETIESGTRAMVYQFGFRRTGDHIEDLDSITMGQLRLSNDFGNELIAISNRYEDNKIAIWRSVPEVDKAWAHVDELTERYFAALDQWQESKVATRDRGGNQELKEAFETIRKEMYEARTVLKKAKEKARPGLKDQFSPNKKELFANATAARKDFAARGLYWPNYNRILKGWQQAFAAVERKREKGEWAKLRFRRWTGEGQISVQLQRSPGLPPKVEIRLSFNRQVEEDVVRSALAEGLEFKLQHPNGNSMLFTSTTTSSFAEDGLSLVVLAKGPHPTEEWNGIAAGLQPELIGTDPAIENLGDAIESISTISAIDKGKDPEPFRTPAALTAGKGKWANQVTFPEQQDRKHKSPITIRTSRDENDENTYQTFNDVVWHRPIPENADITDVVINRQRFANEHRLFLNVTVKLPKPPPSTAPGICGIDTGWRVMPDGSIRVAIWRAKNNRSPQELIKSLKVGGSIGGKDHDMTNAVIISGEGGEVRIPHKYVAKWGAQADLRSQRDKELEQLKADLIELWPNVDKPEELAEITIKDLKSWRSPSRFAYLARTFREYDQATKSNERHVSAVVGFDVELAKSPVTELLEKWKIRNDDMWYRETELSREFRAWRKNTFRVVARMLCEQNAKIAVEEPFVAKITKKGSDNTIADDATRRASVLAAPSDFILAVRHAADDQGVTVTTQAAKDTTLMHAACGHKNTPGAGAKNVMIKCEGCGESYDQDVNSANTLRDALITS